MKLCLVTPGFSASEDDWCIPALHHLVRRLAADHEVTVLALRHPPRHGEYGFFGARVLPLASGMRTGGWRIAMLLRAMAMIAREHRSSAFDVIHGLWADEAGFVAATAGRWLGVRSVVSIMGGELVGLPEIGYGVQLGRTGRTLVRRSLATAAVVTTGSSGLMETARAFRGSKPLVVAPLGVDAALFNIEGERATLEGDPCLLQVGSLTPVKNHRLSIAAFAKIARVHPGAHLHLVGTGPLKRELAARSRALSLGERVHFHASVPHHDLPAIYRAADLHLVSSVFESQCMVVLEAAACGIGTIGTRVGILPMLERDGAARTVDPDDPVAFAAALHELIADRHLVRSLGDLASAHVRADFTVERCGQRFEGIYLGAESAPGIA